jgi:hypothetical protein
MRLNFTLAAILTWILAGVSTSPGAVQGNTAVWSTPGLPPASAGTALPFAPAGGPPFPQAVRPAAGETLAAMAADVSKDVSALRGWPFKRPVRTETATAEEVRRYALKDMDESLGPDKGRLRQAFLRTIGLIPASLDLKATWLAVLEDQVAGFYDPEEKTLRLVARGSTPSLIQQMLLAHELTHALDDQYVDLDAFLHAPAARTEDGELAAESVTEGSATSLMVQYMARKALSGPLDASELQQYVAQEAERDKVLQDAPAYFSAMVGSYVCGTLFLARGPMLALVLTPDNKAVGENFLAAVRTPPVSTEQILHPEKYWDAARRDEPVAINDSAAATWLNGKGRWIVHSDTVGEMLTAILTAPPGRRPDLASLDSSAWTNAASSGWGGDRFYLLASGDTEAEARRSLDALRGVWVTAWDTEKDRDEFVSAAGSLARAFIQPDGDKAAVVYFGFEETERATLVDQFGRQKIVAPASR